MPEICLLVLIKICQYQEDCYLESLLLVSSKWHNFWTAMNLVLPDKASVRIFLALRNGFDR